MSGALEGLIVVECCRGIGGSFAAKILADMGAEAIKMEPPGGHARRWAPPALAEGGNVEYGVQFLALNCNKKGITLDLEKPGGPEILRELVARADVFIEDFPPGYLRNIGLSYEDV